MSFTRSTTTSTGVHAGVGAAHVSLAPLTWAVAAPVNATSLALVTAGRSAADSVTAQRSSTNTVSDG